MRLKPGRPSTEDAAALALQGLTFLASDDARLTAFLNLTGLDPSSLRDVASTSDFQTAVLDYLLADESLLLVFCAETGIQPERVAPIRAALGSTPDY